MHVYIDTRFGESVDPQGKRCGFESDACGSGGESQGGSVGRVGDLVGGSGFELFGRVGGGKGGVDWGVGDYSCWVVLAL